MITCSQCKKFISNITYEINGLEDIRNVRGDCKKHGNVEADWDDYDEIYSGSHTCMRGGTVTHEGITHLL